MNLLNMGDLDAILLCKWLFTWVNTYFLDHVDGGFSIGCCFWFMVGYHKKGVPLLYTLMKL